MLRHLKGPLPCTVVLLLLAFAAHGGGTPVAPNPGGEGGGYPITRALASAFAEGAQDRRGTEAVALVALALAGGLFFLLALRFTGNRIVSFLTAALFVVHPAGTLPLGSPDALVHAVPLPFAIGALLAREEGWIRVRLSRSPWPFELLGVVLAGLAFASGPIALALPFLLLLVEVVFHGREAEARHRDMVSMAALWVVLGFALWHFDDPKKFAFAGPISSLAERGARFVLLPVGGALSVVVTTLVLAAGLGLLVVGLRTLRVRPRWVAVYAGFGVAWWLCCEAPSIFGCIPLAAKTPLLSIAGFGLALAASAWRLALRIVPEAAPRPVGEPMPRVDRAAIDARSPDPMPLFVQPTVVTTVAMPAPPVPAPPPTSAPVPNAARVREAVESAVASAVETTVTTLARGLRSLGGAAAQVAPAVAGAAPVVRGVARATLDDAWRDLALEEGFFETWVHPCLTRTSRVLEVGAAGGRFTSRLVEAAGEVLLVDTDLATLSRVLRATAASGRCRAVRADTRSLRSLGSGTFDFALVADLLLRLPAERAFALLQDLRELLRNGGRAVLVFANLTDPLGFRHLEQAAGAFRAGRPSGDLVFTSPEAVRRLVEGAGLGLVSLHLAANNRDLVVVVEREP